MSIFENANDNLYKKIAFRIFPILVVVQVIAFLDRVNVSFAQIQMKSEIGFGNAAYGLGAGIFFIGYFLFELPSNLLLKKVGARIWFTRILVTWGAATLAMAFVTDVKIFYLLRFLVGAAEAGFAPGTQLYFSKWFPDAYRGRFNGIFLTAIPASFILGGPISGLVLSHFDSIGGLSGWRWLFVLEGGATIALAPLMLLLLPDGPEKAPWLNEAERDAIAEHLTPTSQHQMDHRLGAVLSDRSVLEMSVIYFLLMTGLYGVTFWMPMLLHDAGIASAVSIGWLSALPYVAAAIFMPIASRRSDRRGSRTRYLQFCAFAAAAGMILTAACHGMLVPELLGLCLTASCVLASVPIYWADIARAHPGPTAPAAFAVINSIGNLAGFVSPYVVGLIIDRTASPVTGLYALAISIALGGCALLAGLGGAARRVAQSETVLSERVTS